MYLTTRVVYLERLRHTIQTTLGAHHSHHHQYRHLYLKQTRHLSFNPFARKSATTGPGERMGIKQLISAHGPAAVLTYGVLTFVSYFGFYYALASSGVSPAELMKKLPFRSKQERNSASTPPPAATTAGGGSPAETNNSLSGKVDEMMVHIRDEIEDTIVVVEDALVSGFESVDLAFDNLERALSHTETVSNSQDQPMKSDPSSHANDIAKDATHSGPGTGTTVIVALAIHELFLPVRLALVAALTPRVAARMKGSVLDVWMRRLGSSMKHAKDSLKSAFIKLRGR